MLACLGNAADISTWSNIPYFLFQAAHPRGFLTHALDLMDPNYRWHRSIWNAMSPLRGERPGCYQYSRANVRRMWERVEPELRGGEILSHFQVFPPLDMARRAGTRHSFYCDATLQQLNPGGPDSMPGGRRTYRDALAREKELYHSARVVISMALETARFLISEYEVPAEKVFTVRPGANLDETAVQQYLAQRGPAWRESHEGFTAQKPARLGFIGRDWRRKGLLRLFGTVQLLHARGHPVILSVIGDCPEYIAQHPLVEFHGLISKASDTMRFLGIMDDFAIGCLPSYSEPLGISTLECLRLGIPVMGTRVGGIPDCVSPDDGFLVDRNATDEEIAEDFERHVFEPGAYRQKVAGACSQMGSVTWGRTVERLVSIFGENGSNLLA